MARYKDDPRWINVRYAATCGKCEEPIRKGARAYYYPKGKAMFCENCGTQKAAAFQAAAWDEDNNTSL